MALQLRLQNVVSPGNNDEIVVTRGDPPANVNVGSGGQILDGDLLNGAADASADIVVWDPVGNQVDGEVLSFEGAEPTTIEVNWDEVTQVDEYYEGGPYRYDILTTDPEFGIGIQG